MLHPIALSQERPGKSASYKDFNKLIMIKVSGGGAWGLLVRPVNKATAADFKISHLAVNF